LYLILFVGRIDATYFYINKAKLTSLLSLARPVAGVKSETYFRCYAHDCYLLLYNLPAIIFRLLL